MKYENIKHRAAAAAVSAVMLLSALPAMNIWAADVEETPGLQLQTILINNDGKDWTTQSWGGHTMTPNTNWTALRLEDYYENGILQFEVINNGTADGVSFRIGLASKKHGVKSQINWTDMEEYKGKMTADTQWKSYSLPIKALIDAHADSDFSLENFWYVAVNAVPSGTTLSFRNMKITSTDDERQFPIIKVNQVGYAVNAAKIAYVSCFEKFGSLNGKTYEIVNAEDDSVVASGILQDGKLEETFSGEVVHVLRFDEVTESGTYYIRIPNAGLDPSARSPKDIADGLELDTLTSYSFRIRNHVYDDLMNDLAKYYYYQRQGIDLEETYAGVFARENLHPGDAKVVRWSDRNNPNAETFDLTGGWYDAGDYGKYTCPGAGAVEDLLLAYELFPESFAEMDPKIPETDPAHALYTEASAILAEAKWELDMLLQLEHNSKDGSFYVAANYANDVIYVEDTLYNSTTHESDPSQRDLRSHQATANMAAVLAHAYLVYKDVPVYADFAETCLTTAQRAWNWVTDPVNPMHMSIGAANRTYTFDEKTLKGDMLWAAGSMYRAMKAAGKNTDVYEDYIIENCALETNNFCFTTASISYAHSGRAFLGFFHYLYGNPDADAAVKDVFSKYESWRTRTMRYDNFGTNYPTWGYWWGSNKCMAQSAMTIVLGDLAWYGKDALPSDHYTAVEGTFHYLMGVNPLSFSYVSGYGENCVDNIFSAIYSTDARLEPYQTPAGYFTEGANNHNNPHLSKFTGKCYIDSDAEYTTNENTIYGNAAMILLTAAMMAKLGTDHVRGDVNADGLLSMADLIMMQKWLVCGGELNDWKAGDMNADGAITTDDLCMIKQVFLPQ